MEIFGRRNDDESMDPQELLARGHADMARSSGGSATSADGSSSGPEPDSPLRLTVADVFMIKRRGTVVTGLVDAGTARVGASIRIERDGQVVAQTQIAGIEKFRATVDEAGIGENIGLLLPELDREVVRSGDVIIG